MVRSTRPTTRGWPTGACGTTGSTSPRSARRRGRRCSPGATTTRSASARSASSPAGSRATRRSCRGTARRCRGSCGTTATARRPSASGTSRPMASRGRPGRSIAGRTAGASTTSTASWAVEPASGTRSGREPEDHRVAAELRRRADPYYLPDAMADKTIEWLHGVRAQDAEKPFFVYFSTGCSHAPHHVAEAWADRIQGQVRPGLGPAREETFARQKELGVDPGRRRADAAQRGVPRLGRRAGQAQGVLRTPDGGLRRLLGERRLQRRPGDRRDRGAGRARQHARHLDLGRQRRQHGRDPNRIVQRADDAERHPAHRRDAAPARRALRRDGGLGHARSWRRTTARRGRGPATHRSSGASRSARTSVATATRWSSIGRPGSPTRARYGRTGLT